MKIARSSGRLAVGSLSVLLLVVAAVGVAHAATSGRIYKGQINNQYTLCSEARIVWLADNQAFTSSFGVGGVCDPGDKFNASSGWLGARAYGYRDGALCSYTGWAYNSVATYEFGVGGSLCSNPSGTQEFWTKADSRGWHSSGMYYVDYSMVTSPTQIY